MNYLSMRLSLSKNGRMTTTGIASNVNPLPNGEALGSSFLAVLREIWANAALVRGIWSRFESLDLGQLCKAIDYGK